LVGASGSGKSTIVRYAEVEPVLEDTSDEESPESLVERFYDPVRGNVKLDGRDIRKLNVRWLRSKIGLVSQEPTLFAVSVFVNVSHGLIGTEYENVDMETKKNMVVEACKLANADGFISSMPEGYDTNLGMYTLRLRFTPIIDRSAKASAVC
jgi:ATP-binding cassette subfamily B (MDR/TAP) protein 1